MNNFSSEVQVIYTKSFPSYASCDILCFVCEYSDVWRWIDNVTLILNVELNVFISFVCSSANCYYLYAEAADYSLARHVTIYVQFCEIISSR